MMKKLLIFVVLVLYSFILQAQNCAKDTFYILLPEDYILEEGFIEKYNVIFSKSLDIGKIGNGVIEGCSTHYILLYRFSSWHNRPPEEDFGLLRNENLELTNDSVFKKALLNKKVRRLRFIYGQITGNSKFRRSIRWADSKVKFWIIKEEDFNNDQLGIIPRYSCEFYYYYSIE